MYSKYNFFNHVAYCFLYEAKDLSAPFNLFRSVRYEQLYIMR
jgi:hypothetical protein